MWGLHLLRSEEHIRDPLVDGEGPGAGRTGEATLDNVEIGNCVMDGFQEVLVQKVGGGIGGRQQIQVKRLRCLHES